MSKGEDLEKPKKGGMVIVIGVGAKPKMKDKSKMKKAEGDESSSPRRRRRGLRRGRTTGVAQAMQQRFNRGVGEGRIDLRNIAEKRGIEEQELEGELARFNTSIEQLQSGEEVPKGLDLQGLLNKLGARSTGATQQFFQRVANSRRISQDKLMEKLGSMTDATGKYQLDEVNPMQLEQDPNNEELKSAVRAQQSVINAMARESADTQRRIRSSFRSSGTTTTDDPDDILYGGTDPTEESRQDEAIDTLARLLMGATNPRGSNALFTPEEAREMATRYIDTGEMSSHADGLADRSAKMPLRSQMFPQPHFTRLSSPHEEEAEEGMISFPRSMIEPTDKTGVANARVLNDPKSPYAGKHEESVPQSFRMSEDALTVLDAAWALLKGNRDMRDAEGRAINHPAAMVYDNLAAQIQMNEGQPLARLAAAAQDDDETAADVMESMRKPTHQRKVMSRLKQGKPASFLDAKMAMRNDKAERNRLRGYREEAREQTRNTMDFGNEDDSPGPNYGVQQSTGTDVRMKPGNIMDQM